MKQVKEDNRGACSCTLYVVFNTIFYHKWYVTQTHTLKTSKQILTIECANNYILRQIIAVSLNTFKDKYVISMGKSQRCWEMSEI